MDGHNSDLKSIALLTISSLHFSKGSIYSLCIKAPLIILTVAPATALYNSASHAIVAFHVVNTQTILFYIENSAGDLSQNGLWKINANGGGPTRLTSATGQRCFNPYSEYWPKIASNGQSYAQIVSPSQTIEVGNLAGGTPITLMPSAPAGAVGMLLVLIGMA